MALSVFGFAAAWTIVAAHDNVADASPTAVCCAHERERDLFSIICTGRPIDQQAAYAAPVL